MGDVPGSPTKTASATPTATPSRPGGRHARAGLALRADQGPARLRRARRQQESRADHRRRRDGHRRRDAVGLHPRARIPGPDQGQARHVGGDAHRRERRQDAFDHWLADSPQQADALLEWAIEQAEDRLRAAARRKSRARPRRASCVCPASSPTAPSNAAGGPKSSSSRATRPAARPSRRAIREDAGGPAAARQDPQRRQRLIGDKLVGRTSSCPTSSRRSASARAASTATRTCATTASSS
jgi:hypothetical protein